MSIEHLSAVDSKGYALVIKAQQYGNFEFIKMEQLIRKDLRL